MRTEGFDWDMVIGYVCSFLLVVLGTLLVVGF